MIHQLIYGIYRLQFTGSRFFVIYINTYVYYISYYFSVSLLMFRSKIYQTYFLKNIFFIHKSIMYYSINVFIFNNILTFYLIGFYMVF